MIAKLGGRKFIVVMFALICGTLIAFLCDAPVLQAYAVLVGAVVTAFMGANAAQDWKHGGKPDAAS